MKVGTDGIVLGAWTNPGSAKVILDAGAGNGYVGIMQLQRALPNTKLIGVEIEPGAAAQCEENYAIQPFDAQTEVWKCSLQEAADKPQYAGLVDLMLSNPPFYRDKPKSPIAARNLARHDDTLKMGDLAKAAMKLLAPGGRLTTIWPMDRKEEWEGWAHGCGFQIARSVPVQTMRHIEPKRLLSEWVRNNPAPNNFTHESPLTLEGSATLDYTDEYLEIVRPYLRGT